MGDSVTCMSCDYSVCFKCCAKAASTADCASAPEEPLTKLREQMSAMSEELVSTRNAVEAMRTDMQNAIAMLKDALREKQ